MFYVNSFECNFNILFECDFNAFFAFINIEYKSTDSENK